MYQYFKSMQALADTDKREFENIYDLTVELIKSSGYDRHVKLKNDGTPSAYTVSTYSKWNEPLVAKWMLYFKNAFMAKLSKQPGLAQYHADIIQRTFHYLFQEIDLDKLKHSGQVVKLFNSQLSIRISEALHVYGTEGRFNRLSTGEQKNSMQVRNAAAFASVSLNQLMEEQNMQFSDGISLQTDSFVISLYSLFDDKPKLTIEQFKNTYHSDNYDKYIKHYNTLKFRNNIGKRLLDVLLSARRTYDPIADEEKREKCLLEGKVYKEPSYTAVDEGMVVPDRIIEYMEFSREEVATESMRKLTEAVLKSAYSKIIDTFRKHLKDTGINIAKYDWNIKLDFQLQLKNMQKLNTKLEKLKKSC